MTLVTAVRSGASAPLRHPTSVLPFYLLTLGAMAAARIPLFLGLGIALAILVARGRIEPVVRELQGIDWSSVEQTSGGVSPELSDALAGLVTPGVVVAVLLGMLAFMACAVLTRAVAMAGTHSALYGALQGENPSETGVAGIATHWRPFVLVGMLRALFVGGAAVGAFLGVILTVTIYGAIIGIPLLLLSLVVGLPALLLLAFAGTAVVVDDVGTIGALRQSVSFPLREPGAFLVYVALLAIAGVGLAIVGAAFEFMGIPRLAAVLSTLLVFPLLDGIKVALYADADLPAPEFEHLPIRVRHGARDSLVGLGQFLWGHPLANLAGLVTMLGGILVGWLITAPYGTRLNPPPDIATTFGTIPVGPFLNIAANNWLVAAGGGYGGLAFGVPTAGSLLFNGVFIGAIAGVFDPVAFLALVGPHGLFEIPALAVGGGLGFHLGRVGWDGIRGRRTAAEVGAELERGFRILLGLVPVFVLAAFIEAFITPHVAAMVVG